MQYVDIPSLEELRALAAERADACVSLWIRTTPLTQNTGASRIELRNLAKEAVEQLEAKGLARARVSAIAERVEILAEDDEFWRLQSESLAVLVTPESLRSYRLPNHFRSAVEVSDRFHIAPLARSIAFPYAGYVLALGQKSVRLIEFAPQGAVDISAEANLPGGLEDALGRALPRDPAPSGRLQGAEGRKVLVAQYARRIDAALRGHLGGGRLPLVLAAVEHVDAIYRSVNSYPFLVMESISGNFEHANAGELAALAQPVLQAAYDRGVAAGVARFEEKRAAGFGLTDLTDIARAATRGAIQTLFFDIEEVVYGTVDEAGGVTIAKEASADTYDVVGEVVCRVLLTGGEAIGLRSEQLPGAALGAVTRYLL